MKRGLLLSILLLTVGGAALAGPLVLLSDFGTRDGAVCVMKGVALEVDPGVGTTRKSLLLETRSGHIFIGPDWTIAVRRTKWFMPESCKSLSAACPCEAPAGRRSNLPGKRDCFGPLRGPRNDGICVHGRCHAGVSTNDQR